MSGWYRARVSYIIMFRVVKDCGGGEGKRKAWRFVRPVESLKVITSNFEQDIKKFIHHSEEAAIGGPSPS